MSSHQNKDGEQIAADRPHEPHIFNLNHNALTRRQGCDVGLNKLIPLNHS